MPKSHQPYGFSPDPLRAGYRWCRTSSQPQKVRFAPDLALEGGGFEPSVPLVRPVPEWLEKGARALCAWSAEMRAHP